MMSRAAWLLFVVGALTVVRAQDSPTFRAQARLVVLHATVVNRHGKLVTNLDRDAFTVREDGKPQSIAVFGRDDVPVSLGILIDNSGSMKDKRAQVEAAALALVRASNPQDEVFVMNFADEPHLDVPFTMNINQLESGIRRADAIGGTAMRDAVDAAIDYLRAHATRDRRALLVVTDGNDNASVTPMAQVRRKVTQAEAVIFAIGVLSDADAPGASKARHELEDCAEMTGGRAFFPERLDAINATALDIAHQLRSQYTIAYTPQNQAFDGGYRRIQVAARGTERLVVRTRAGYFARPGDAAALPRGASTHLRRR
ncbi:MAG TPA: VWA domain-containing protein [Vicinamibacterales bacterium]|nr:VWA domain-containing protein [Vicinamibacterales bacterium]